MTQLDQTSFFGRTRNEEIWSRLLLTLGIFFAKSATASLSFPHFSLIFTTVFIKEVSQVDVLAK